jgi:hypothetical protein
MNIISNHFTYSNVIASQKAIELNIDNTLPSIYYGNVINLAKFILEPIREHFGRPFSPLSWYRCPALNEAVGGSKTSDHMIGAAADIRLDKVSLMALAEYIRDNLQFDQLIVEPTWIHVSHKKGNNRMEVLHKIESGYDIGLGA